MLSVLFRTVVQRLLLYVLVVLWLGRIWVRFVPVRVRRLLILVRVVVVVAARSVASSMVRRRRRRVSIQLVLINC